MIKIVQLSDCIKHIPLNDYQNQNKLLSMQLSEHISMDSDNVLDKGSIVVNELLLTIFEEIRAEYIKLNPHNKSIHINDLFRLSETQAGLVKSGKSVAVLSAHQMGWAMDVKYSNDEDGQKLYKAIKTVRARYNGIIRIGFKQYREEKKNFIHFDIAPYCYAKLNGKNGTIKLPEHWKELNVEW
jgi:hypothetical protein